MKIKHIFLSVLIASSGFIFTACDNYLDEVPEASISPEVYFTEATHIQASADNLYSDILPSHGTGNTYGIYKDDATTDNQIEVTAPNRFTSTLWKVDNAETSNWNFDKIYKINFVLSNVLPNFGDKNADGNDLSGNANTINGDLNSIKHYIGELFFLRACEYFKRYQLFGDFPIITHPLLDDKEALSEASKRSPRNEVARFILSDLDKAITLLKAKNMPTTRINADAAILLKSRVALFEGTWLKYFKNTAFVPNGDGWPGKTKDYNSTYQYPSGNIDSEIDYFLEIAMTASKDIAERYKNRLTENTGVLQQSTNEDANPYFDMFAQEDLSSVDEVLLWRRYAYNLVHHNVNVYASWGNNGVGVTRSFVNNFLMADGTPVYRTLKLLQHIPFVKEWAKRFSENKREALERVDSQIAELHKQRRSTFYASLSLEFMARIIGCLEVYFILNILTTDVSFPACILIMAFTSLFANLFFFSPMQLGAREGGFALAVGGLAIPGAFGVYTGLITRVRELIWIVIGVLLMKVGNGTPANK